jgi:hypothetical protein
MHLYLDLDQKSMNECSTKLDDCVAYKQVLIQINHIRSYMTSQTKLTKDLIFKMVPQVTTKFNSRSKRALLPFVGNIAINLFGVATEGDVRKLASHINALTKQNNKIVGALKQYGGNFASFLTQTDKRISNAVQGIKTNALVLNRLRILMETKFSYSSSSIFQLFCTSSITKSIPQ